jgi:hypothetical protein
MSIEMKAEKREIPISVWQGVVLEESLRDNSLLDLVDIVGTDVDKLEEENRVMTFHKVEIPNSFKDEYIKLAENNIKKGFYTHLCKDGEMIVIFNNKVFSFNKDDSKLIEAREYGKSIGIIVEQMPFEHLIDHPFD